MIKRFDQLHEEVQGVSDIKDKHSYLIAKIQTLNEKDLRGIFEWFVLYMDAFGDKSESTRLLDKLKGAFQSKEPKIK